MINYKFSSVFAPHMLSFVKMKEAMGYTSSKIEYIFKELDQLAVTQKLSEPIITKDFLTSWRATRLNDSDRTLYDKWSVISQFSRYLCHCGLCSYVPLMPRAKNHQFFPHIFTHEEMQRFFTEADRLETATVTPSLCLFSMPAMFRLIYATGIREGEALALNNEDVDLKKGTLLLKKTKNQRQRLIPLTPSLTAVLSQYLDYKKEMPIGNVDEPTTPFFISQSGARISKSTVYHWFRKILKKCGIPHIGNRKGPRVHDLRHTFAVHTLMKQVRAGKDLYCLLPILSVFMGHKTLFGTETYVRLTSEMFPELNLQISEISSYIFPSLEKIVREYEE